MTINFEVFGSVMKDLVFNMWIVADLLSYNSKAGVGWDEDHVRDRIAVVLHTKEQQEHVFCFRRRKRNSSLFLRFSGDQ